MEICGETEDGRRVIANPVLPCGGFAEYAVADAAALLPAPDALDDAEAAALHIGYQTGWFGLHRRAGLEAGETLLVHAAAGGVGSAAVQLGKAAGATVIGVVGGAAKASVARELGCDVVIDRRERDVVARREGGHRRPGAPTWSTTPSAARPTPSPPRPSPSRAGSSSSASRAGPSRAPP
ncbi:hypothetical protein GCM10023238_23350 [Streptomyces heliomycini]